MELEPELIRAVRLDVCLSGWGKHWRDNGSGSLGLSESSNLSQETKEFDNFLSHDWGTGRWEKMVSLLILFNAKPASLTTLIVSLLLMVLSFLGPSLWAPLGALLSLLTFVVTFCFWQRIRSIFRMKAIMVFLDKLCIAQHDPVKKKKGIQGLGCFLDHSKTLTILWSPRYFSRLWCGFELATFLRHKPYGDPSEQRAVEIMPTKLAVFFCAYMIACHASFDVLMVAGNFVGRTQDAEQRLIESATVVAVIVLMTFLVEGVTLYCGIGLMKHIKVLPQQLSNFNIDEAKCYCCSNNHIHPETGATMQCDRILVYEAVKGWYGDAEKPGEHLNAFNATVRKRLMPIVVEMIGNGRGCLVKLSPMIWAVALPQLVFWFPIYVSDGYAQYGHNAYYLAVWWIRCSIHWCTLPLLLLLAARILWTMCALGSALERKGGYGRGIVAIGLLLPTLLLTICPALACEAARAGSVTPSLLPLAPFMALVTVVLLLHVDAFCPRTVKAQRAEAAEAAESPSCETTSSTRSCEDELRSESQPEEELVECTF